jgi:hypothetical protein
MNTQTETFTKYTLAFGILYVAAHAMIERQHRVQLGNLLHGLRGGDSRYDFPAQWMEPFRDLNEAEVQGVYEGVLYRLEKDFGPLNCIDLTDPTSSAWGYAGLIGVPTDTELELHEQWLKRESSFEAGHPDGVRDWNAKTVPQTLWFTQDMLSKHAA